MREWRTGCRRRMGCRSRGRDVETLHAGGGIWPGPAEKDFGPYLPRAAHKQRRQESPADDGFVSQISKAGKKHNYLGLFLSALPVEIAAAFPPQPSQQTSRWSKTSPCHCPQLMAAGLVPWRQHRPPPGQDVAGCHRQERLLQPCKITPCACKHRSGTQTPSAPPKTYGFATSRSSRGYSASCPRKDLLSLSPRLRALSSRDMERGTAGWRKLQGSEMWNTDRHGFPGWRGQSFQQYFGFSLANPPPSDMPHALAPGRGVLLRNAHASPVASRDAPGSARRLFMERMSRASKTRDISRG